MMEMSIEKIGLLKRSTHENITIKANKSELRLTKMLENC